MDALTRARHQLVDAVFRKLGLRDVELQRVMREVPRHLFVDSALNDKAVYSSPAF
jgi:protein-L-isoaspartate O-methyltransferase